MLEAELVVRAIAAGVNAAKRAERRQHRKFDTPTWEQRQADALVAAITGTDMATTPTTAAAGDPAPSDPGDPPVQGSSDPVPSAPPPSATLVVTVRHEDLVDGALAAGRLSSGAGIPARELRRLACDAEVIPVVLGAASEILDVGRTSRFVTPGIRHALNLRDNGCIVPACEASALECDAHHVVPWWAGGRTSLENLVSLCPYHHAKLEPTHTGDGATSAGGWRITLDPVTHRPALTRVSGTGTDPPLPLTG